MYFSFVVRATILESSVLINSCNVIQHWHLNCKDYKGFAILLLAFIMYKIDT